MEDALYKTLIIRFSSIGDIVLSSLLVRTLHRRFPSAQIDFVVKSEFAELVAHNPYIAHVFALPVGGTFDDLRRLRSRIAPSSYDLVVDIHDSLRSRFLCLGARRVVRVNKRKLARFLLVHTKIDTYATRGGSPGVALRYLETVQPYGVHDDGQGLEVHIPSEIEAAAENVLSASSIPPGASALAICPGAKHANKMWPVERFADVAIHAAQEFGTPIVLLGGKEDYDRCSMIQDLIHQTDRSAIAENLAGTLSLLETATIMDRCSVVLTNDTGLMHLAAARKRKVVAVFGPTVRQFGFFPFGTEHAVVERNLLACRPCTHIGLPHCPKKHFRCMQEITTDDVYHLVHRYVSTP